jgi:hypothetical protein
MKIKEVKLNKNGVEVGEEENPLATRYFDDNGGLANGNYDEDDIARTWVLVVGKHEIGTYAYRTIDDTTLIPVEIYRRKLIGKLTGERILLGAEWLEENDPEMLDWITSSKYWGRGTDRKPDPSEAIVELKFDESGVAYYANLETDKDIYPSQNQPPWGEDNWEDWAVEAIEKYYKKLEY